VKLGKAMSWLKRTLQRTLFPNLEECWNTALSDKELQLVSILELVQVEGFVLRKVDNQLLGRKLRERESIARSLVAKSVYGYPFTSRLIEALKTTPNLSRICGFERVSDIPGESCPESSVPSLLLPASRAMWDSPCSLRNYRITDKTSFPRS